MSQVVMTSMLQRIHEEFSVEPRKHEDVGIQDVFETIQVEIKEKGGEKDVKDGNECLFGEEELRKWREMFDWRARGLDGR